LGSANEMEVHIETAKDLGYWKKEFCENLIIKIQKLRWKTE